MFYKHKFSNCDIKGFIHKKEIINLGGKIYAKKDKI